MTRVGRCTFGPTVSFAAPPRSIPTLQNSSFTLSIHTSSPKLRNTISGVRCACGTRHLLRFAADPPKLSARRPTVSAMRTEGTFVVKSFVATEITPEPAISTGLPVGVSRMEKEFAGGVAGRAATLFTAAFDQATGVGTYVAMESFEGSLDGRTGSFNFAHAATTSGADRQDEYLTIVPSSGTDDLVGITGSGGLTVDDDGTHRIWFDYELADTVTMKVIDHLPAGWFLLEHDSRLYLDARYSYSAVIDDSALVELDQQELAAYREGGHEYISELAEAIHMSAPYREGSPYFSRDLYRGDQGRHWRAQVAAAVAAHRGA